MSKIDYLVMAALTMFFVSCYQNGKTSQSTDTSSEVSNAQFKKFECEQFAVAYPKDYYVKEETSSSVKNLYIGKDSLFREMTAITWEAPNYFQGTVKEFVTVFAYKEYEDYKNAGKFYNVLINDSLITIDGYSTHSISSIFTEDEDTVLISRTGLLIPNMMDMLVTQRVYTKTPRQEILPLIDIMDYIKIKRH